MKVQNVCLAMFFFTVMLARAVTPPATTVRGSRSFDLRDMPIQQPALACVAQTCVADNLAPLGTGTGLTGAYFNNMSLSGMPVTVRLDATVNFNWADGSPDASSVARDNFSARWSGQVQPLNTGTNTFYTVSDDGVRLWVNGQLLVDNWTVHGATTDSGNLVLTAGQLYDITMEYYENTGSAVAQLKWSDTVNTNAVIIPASQLYFTTNNLPDPAITTHPAATNANPGLPATFAVTPWGTPPFYYQWQKNDVSIPDATNASYSTPGVTTNDNNAFYSVVVSNAIGCVTSCEARLRVNVAMPIQPAVLYTNLFCNGDDWYSIIVPTNGTVDASIWFPIGNGSYDLDFYLYDSKTNLVGKSEGSTPGEHILATNCVGGTYYLDVHAWSGAYNTYSLEVFESVITLPDIVAIEMPNPGQTTIAGSDQPLSNLLAAAVATGGLQVTCDAMDRTFTTGGTQVTWTAWSGAPGVSDVAATLSTYVFVFRHGQTPIGVSGDDYATAGNHTACVGRTADGTIHAAWLETGTNPDGTTRPIGIWYRRGTQDPYTGAVIWTDKISVDGGVAAWDSYVKLSITSNTVHFAWYSDTIQKVYYRRLLYNGGAWNFDPVQILTGTTQGHNRRDNSIVVAAFNDQEVHVMASELTYAYNTNVANAAGWVYEHLTGPTNKADWKYPTLAVDSRGDVHAVFTAVMRALGTPSTNYNNYWKVWYMHRKRPGPGSLGWVESHDVNAQWPEWQDPGYGQAGVRNDAAGDWMDIACDNEDTVHIGWHGTGVSRAAGYDDAFCTRRTAAHDGDPLGWERPQRLHHHEDDTVNGLQYSWTPSICCAETNGIVFPVIMCKSLGLVEASDPVDSYEYYNDMDSILRVLQDGTFIDDGDSNDLSQAAVAGEKIATWWPNAARKLYWDANGHAWLDLLQGMDCSWPFNPSYVTGNTNTKGIRTYVVYQQVDVTGFMPPTITTPPADATAGVGQTATFTVAAAGPTNNAPLSYQWTKNGVAIPGATGTSYTTDVAAATDDGNTFAAIVTARSHTTSSAAQLMVDTTAWDNWRIYYFGGTNAANSGATDDWDHDGVNNLAEYLAGTDPTNAASRLAVMSCARTGDGLTISWQSAAGKNYTVQYCTNLAAGFWTDGESHIPAMPPLNTCSGITNPPGASFYRILLEP